MKRDILISTAVLILMLVVLAGCASMKCDPKIVPAENNEIIRIQLITF